MAHQLCGVKLPPRAMGAFTSMKASGTRAASK
jgi:hypothetical protein